MDTAATQLRTDGKALVCSVIGETGVGKSTFIAQTIKACGGDVRSAVPTRGTSSDTRSTTAGVNLFPVRGIGKSGMLLLDFEGTAAGTKVPTDALDSAWATMGCEAMEQRGQIVANQLPRIAFVVSNVIIFFSEANWKVHRPWEECLNFAQKACTGVRDADRDELPLLVIVNTHADAKVCALGRRCF
jgi:hypothetical protein